MNGEGYLSKKTTSRDVAKAAGVSQSLVSLILNNVTDKKIKPETRELVLKTARDLNYRVNINARNMKSRRAGAIGILSIWKTNSFVFPPVIDGVQSVCSQNDLGVIICTGDKRPSGLPDYIEYYMQNRIDGLIYVSYVGVGRDGVIDELEKNGVPFVCIIGARDIPRVSCVDVNFFESGYMAVKHLAESGYRNTAYFCNERPENGVYAEKERFEGCRKAASDFELDLVFDDAFMNTLNENNRLQAIEKVVKAKRYDSVISTSHGCYTVLRIAAKLGILVPEDLGVISLDNELFAPYLFPSLTTIDEPLFDIAKKAMYILLDKIQGQTVNEKVELTPFISIRESTSKSS